MGLRPAHYSYLETSPTSVVKWFEAISENYMYSSGRPREMLHKIRKDYPVALHGVSMSIASAEKPDLKYLKTLKALIDEVEPFIVSDHLCWTGTSTFNIHDLLPFPFTCESLDIVVRNLDIVQNALQRPMVLENVSSYMTFTESSMSEQDFLVSVLERSGAGLLLDINNVYVSAENHGFNASDFIQALPVERVQQIHLAGFTDMGDFLFDTHSKPVHPGVWRLFSEFIQRSPETPFMVEWDEDIPSFLDLEKELQQAISIWQHHQDKGVVCDLI